ncbi:MAG: hypothetical protein GX660_27845 [Clostridiaceae bacterium]|nr:hypothetical protein [Clostridiaceae bacterium]
MNILKVQRLYEVKQQIRELEIEEDLLVREFKEEMKQDNIKETVIGDYRLLLQCQDRSIYRNSIVPYLKEKGLNDLIFETYDHDKLFEVEKQGILDENELKKHRVERLYYYLYVKPC